MTTALVTGAAGLLGRAVVNELADAGIGVHAIVRSSEQAFRDDVEFHEVDLTTTLDARVLPGKVDKVIHLAQAREFRDFPASALTVFTVNVVSTVSLLAYAARAGTSSFVYASSGGVYRGGAGTPITEESPLHAPEDLGYYLSTKLASEAFVGSYQDHFSTSALRYFFIYGPGQERSMLVPRLYDRVRNGEALSLQGDAGMRINPVHVSDAAAATVAAAFFDGGLTANIAGPETVSLKEMGELFGRDSGQVPVFEHSAGAAADLIASTERMRDRLVAPVVTLGQALSDIRE